MSEQQHRFNPVTPAIVDRLKGIVGEKFVIFNDHERMEPFSHDETPGKEYAHMPEVVVRPATAQEISAIIKLANQELIPVTPRGAGSGLSGGAVPLFGGILVSCDRMNRIIEIDRENMMIVVEPGVVANEINEAIRDFGLFYAGYPMSLETCFIGGNVAENAGGGKAVKYGVTSRYVLGLEVVTPTGEIVELGGKLVKDVTGYNLVQLMIGSEGTLGLFTKIILKLIPWPKYQVDLLCLFKDSADAIAVVPKIMTGACVPTSIEYMDRDCVQAACRYLNESIPYEDAGAMLLISIDGDDRKRIEDDYLTVGDFCSSAGAFEVYVADNPTTSERVWKVRRNILEAYSVQYERQSGEDIVVPPASIPVVVAKTKEIAARYGLAIPCYGHAGDGNLHASISPPDDWSDQVWKETLALATSELYALLRELGGRISGEHGIGHKRKSYMRHVVSGEYIDMLRSVKLALDPNSILNPGKIFD